MSAETSRTYLTPANVVTMIRIAATPGLLLVMLESAPSWGVTLLWAALASTDKVDGWLARRHGVTSSGVFLDPLADKILVLGALIVLVSQGEFSWIPVVLIGIRELGISGYRTRMARRGISVPARPWGKAKTLVQTIAVGLALVPIGGGGLDLAAELVLWTAAVLAVLSGAQYLLDGEAAQRGSPMEEPADAL